MGSGMAIVFIGAFVFGVLARCMINERRAREQARAHVQALALQDREFWGAHNINPRRQVRRRGGEGEGEEEGTQAQEQRQERREREHGRFDSVLERIEKRALQEDTPGEPDKGLLEVGVLDDQAKDSGSKSGDAASAVAKPEPVYKAIRICKGGIRLPSLRSGIS